MDGYENAIRAERKLQVILIANRAEHNYREIFGAHITHAKVSKTAAYMCPLDNNFCNYMVYETLKTHYSACAFYAHLT